LIVSAPKSDRSGHGRQSHVGQGNYHWRRRSRAHHLFRERPDLWLRERIINVMLAASVVLPTADGGTVSHGVAVAHLRCNLAAAAQLRDAIDKALLIASPPSEGKAT
jgi:hypothetical protein